MGQQCWKGGNPDTQSTDTETGATTKSRTNDDHLCSKVYETADEPRNSAATEHDRVFKRISEEGLSSVSTVDDGYFAAGAEDGSLSLTKGEATTLFKGHSGDVRRLHYCKARNMLASCSRDKTIKLWDTSDKTKQGLRLMQTLEGHSLAVANCCTNSDGSRVFSGSRDTSVRLWDVETGEQLRLKKTTRNLVHCMAWLEGPEFENVVVQGGENLKLYLWDVRDNKICQWGDPLAGVPDQPVCMLRNPANGLQIFVGYKGFDETSAVIRLWDMRSLKEVARYAGHNKCIVDVSSTRALPGHPEHTLVSCSQDRTIRVWPSICAGLQEGTSTQISFPGAPTDMTTIDDSVVVVTSEGHAFSYQFDANTQQYVLSASYVS
ncbi:hypothetical protein DIPPA_56411 [Diplonema papillatum]|nr:hypothetical protein DIPPA_56411 [Diplonema papillatum]